MAKRKIVIADDDRDLTELLRRMLEIEGYSVVTANDGQAAIEAHKREKPDMLILDVNMPVKDGIQVCGEIRRQDKTVLILMLTGQKTQTNTVVGLGAGADGYVTKPFGSRELLARIKSLFRRLDV